MKLDTRQFNLILSSLSVFEGWIPKRMKEIREDYVLGRINLDSYLGNIEHYKQVTEQIEQLRNYLITEEN